MNVIALDIKFFRDHLAHLYHNRNYQTIGAMRFHWLTWHRARLAQAVK